MSFKTLLFSTAFAALIAGSAASAFEITPITRDFEPSGRGANQSFQITNDRDEQVTVSVSVATRQVNADGKETHNPTSDFTVFPTEVVLPPRGTQVVRARWNGDANPKTELAYRIIAEETPVKQRRDAPGAAIYMTVRYVGSLYVVPKGAKGDVTVTSAQRATGQGGKPVLELMLENRGTSHVIMEDPSLKVTVGTVTKTLDATALEGSVAGENVLAQHTRRFSVTWPEGLPQGAVKAELAYTAQR
jgi:fimbrial chaperone protein